MKGKKKKKKSNITLLVHPSHIHIRTRRGFNYILKEESKKYLDGQDPRLMLNTLVTKVIYNDHNVTVLTSDGDIIVADYAICTFS